MFKEQPSNASLFLNNTILMKVIKIEGAQYGFVVISTKILIFTLLNIGHYKTCPILNL